MPAKKSKKTEILADIVRALRDKNTVIQIQTIGTYRRGDTKYFDGAEHTPAYKGEVIDFIDGHKKSANARDAVSIKINDDIQIHKKANIDDTKSSRYIVHTPHGEISLPLLDSDMELLWNSSMHIYEEQIGVTPNGFARAHQQMKRSLDDPELRKILDAPVVEKDTKSKFEKAKAKMAALGIEKTENLDAYIAQQQAMAQSK